VDNYPLGYFLNKPPEAKIVSITPNPATVGQTIEFKGSIIYYGPINKREWRIDGKLVGTTKDFTYTGLSSGTYTVTFRVQASDDTWSNTDSSTLIVNPAASSNKKPVVTSITILPDEAIYGETVYFSGEAYDPDSGDAVIGFEWNSTIDGFLSNQKSFSVNNLTIGEHAIYFRVKDTRGTWSDPMAESISIIQNPAIENNPPIADAGGFYSGITNTSITFDGSNSYDIDEGDNITEYKWDFGDGNTSNGKIVQHIYPEKGNYTVKLTVKDSYGEIGTDYTNVTVAIESQDQPNEVEENDTPGFEIIFIIISLLAIIFFKKYRKETR
ncbi:MAG TPA: PKD domain-containing protein, partial [Bacteroidetes bacterium]|nr:PKD domain-containing protein [Bacteroidota bacterium]